MTKLQQLQKIRTDLAFIEAEDKCCETYKTFILGQLDFFINHVAESDQHKLSTGK